MTLGPKLDAPEGLGVFDGPALVIADRALLGAQEGLSIVSPSIRV